MWNKKWKKIVSLGLVIVTASMCSLGCVKEEEVVTIEPMEKEEVASYSFSLIGGNDVMPIGGFYGPYRSEDTRKNVSYDFIEKNINNRKMVNVFVVNIWLTVHLCKWYNGANEKPLPQTTPYDVKDIQ